MPHPRLSALHAALQAAPRDSGQALDGNHRPMDDQREGDAPTGPTREERRVVLWQASARRVNYLRAELDREDVRSVPELRDAYARELAVLLDGSGVTLGRVPG